MYGYMKDYRHIRQHVEQEMLNKSSSLQHYLENVCEVPQSFLQKEFCQPTLDESGEII